jgi:hypothetical protein
MNLGDVGTFALVGGVLVEAGVRLAKLLGRQPSTDGWREGMFVGASLGLLYWLSEKA